MAGTDSGIPARSAITRAMLVASAGWATQPKMTSSTISGFRPVRVSNALTAMRPNSSAPREASSVPALQKGVRTPFCKAGTELASLGADELGRIAVNALLTRTGLNPEMVDEVIFGCVAQPADATNIARVIALRAGIPESVPAMTVQRNCASGCEAVTLAQERLLAGRGSIFIVGGTASMSNIPFLFKQRTAEKFSRLSRAKGFGQRLQSIASFRPSDFLPRIGLMLGLTDPF